MKTTKKNSVSNAYGKDIRRKRIQVLPRNLWNFQKQDSTAHRVAEEIAWRHCRFYGTVLSIIKNEFGLDYNLASDLINKHTVFKILEA